MNKLVSSLVVLFFLLTFASLKAQCSYTISAGSDKTITCSSATATLAGTTNTTGLTYTWSPGGSAPNSLTTTVTTPGIYTLTSTNPVGGCVTTATVSVITNTTLPDVSAGSNQVRTCAITTVTLTGSSITSGATFSWSPGGNTTAVRTATAAGTFTLKVTNPSNGCSASATVAVTNNTVLPNVNAGTAQVRTCAVPTVTLTGSSSTSGATFSWSPGGNTTAVRTATAAGTYTLKVTDPANSCSSTATVAVTNNTVLPNVSAGTSKTVTCTAPTVVLTGTSTTSGATYSWSPGGATTPTVSISTPGTYTLKVTHPSNGCVASATVSVINNANAPNISAGTNKTITCTSPTAILTGSSSTSGVTYSWSPGGITTTTLSTTTLGTYTLQVFNAANGCSASATVAVTSNTILPDVTAGSDKTITCTAPSAVLTGTSTTSGVTYSWSPGGITTPTRTATSAGIYTLNVTVTASGCYSTSTVSVTSLINLPNVSAGSNQVRTCAITTVTLTGNSSTSGVTYSWSPGGNTTAVRTATAIGTYTLKVTDPSNACISTATVAVTNNTVLPNVSAGATQSITCASATATLNGSSSTSGATFSWTPGAITTPTRTATALGTYTLKVTDPANSCSKTATVSIVSNTVLPNVSAGTTKTITCTFPTAVLTGSSSTAGVTFSWSPAAITTSTAGVTTAGTYTLKVTNPINGCSASSTVAAVSNTTLPNINAGSDKTLTCLVPTTVATGTSSTSGVTYSWSPNGVTTNTAGIVAVGVYTFNVTDPINGCIASSTINVTSNIVILNAAAGTNTVYTTTDIQLGGSPTVSNGTSPYTYLWLPNTGFASGSNNSQANPNVAPSSSTLYNLLITDNLGCTGTAQVFVTNHANSISYGILSKTINGGFTNSVTNKVYFKFEEEYKGTNLNYKIYDLATSSAASANTPLAEISCSALTSFNTTLGGNRYFIDLTCGSFVTNKIYLLEITNSKNEKFYLKFKA